jgi:hypothetical protein
MAVEIGDSAKIERDQPEGEALTTTEEGTGNGELVGLAQATVKVGGAGNLWRLPFR